MKSDPSQRMKVNDIQIRSFRLADYEKALELWKAVRFKHRIDIDCGCRTPPAAVR